MTNEEIDRMPAGGDLDALIAEKLGTSYLLGDSYSTSIRAAWIVVEEMNPKNPLILTFRPIEKDWWVVLPNEAKHPKGSFRHGPDCMVQAFAETAALAICRAALKVFLKS